MTLQQFLDSSRKLADSATEGPWVEFGETGLGDFFVQNEQRRVVGSLHDINFIAESRTRLPLAIDCLEIACAALKNECECSKEPMWLPPLCDACKALCEIERKLK